MDNKVNNLKTFNKFLENTRTQEYLANVLGAKKSSFVNNLTALVSNSKNLQDCEPETLMYAALKATALSLPLDQNLGFAYVIPFKNKNTNKILAQFQIGYKGFIQLSLRSNLFKNINVRDVREGEIKSEDFITGEFTFEMLKEKRTDAPIVGYVAYFKLNSGFEKMLYMSINELKNHGKRFSQSYKQDFGLWIDDFDSMASKTVLKLLLNKYAPLSIEMQNAVIYDQAVIAEENKPEYIDNQTVDIEYSDVSIEEKKQALKERNPKAPEMP